MSKIIGIGGVFIFAQNVDLLAERYQRHLGCLLAQLVIDDQQATYYQELYYRDLNNPDTKLHTVFAIMPAKQDLSTPRNQVMINYRVDDLDTFVQRLNEAGIATDPIHIASDAEGKGKFSHLCDPEGNRIELWQHIEA